MANNNRQGGNNQMNNEHVEFSVKAEEDLYLQGKENTIRRVSAETNYSCLMLKTQRFSSLFRHYAKYHGLRKDDLEYYFVNLLENDDTPETVQLQRGDTIMVRKRRKPEPPEAAADDEDFFTDMKELLDDEEHMDVAFLVHPENNKTNRIKEEEDTDSKMHIDKTMIEVRAHKSVLTARADFFKSTFGGNLSNKPPPADGGSDVEESPSSVNTLEIDPIFNESHVRYVLEFVYTNRIADIRHIRTDDLIQILHMSDKWNLRDLKRLVEHALVRDHMNCDTVARLYGATEDFHAKRLSKACVEFIMSNLRQLAGNPVFEEEMKNYPHLCIPVLKAAADLIPEGPVHKKQRTGEHGGGGGGTPASAGFRSSPVPDSDP